MLKAILKKGKEKRTLYGHPWIYKSDINSVSEEVSPGDIVSIYSYKNQFIGQGYFNPKSQITIRMLTTKENENIDYDFFYKRILNAWNYRKEVADINSCRVIFGESDFLPALIVDKFSDYLVVQTLALGIDKYKSLIVDILNEIIQPKGIFERNDVPVRELEGLEQIKGFLSPEFDTNVLMVENGVEFLVDVKDGQKTGFFLDQKENRAALKPFVKDKKVLDCFSHTGSFALHAGYYGAKSVLGIDISEHATEYATQNAIRNNLENVCSFKTANTFDILRDFYDKNEKFDTIILDPPAFTKSKKTIQSAIRGYKEINLRAMKIINEGGYLVTCSCSHHVDYELFMNILFDAAADARKQVRVVEERFQGKDHPTLLASSETQYLKCIILQIY
jgi:23S rRNA (cytosine1962-C5)-methyltransferase